MSATICIPARRHSKRLPEKVLLAETGQPLIMHTIRAAAASRLARQMVVATDSLKVADACQGLCPTWVEKGEHFWCGTQRAAEAAKAMPHLFKYPVVVNLQADEPMITGRQLDDLIRAVSRDASPIATLVAPLPATGDRDVNVVKATIDGDLIFDFSRTTGSFQHIGVYAFRRDILEAIRPLAPSARSIAESLEQLTWLEEGWPITAVATQWASVSINSRSDYDEFKRIISELESGR